MAERDKDGLLVVIGNLAPVAATALFLASARALEQQGLIRMLATDRGTQGKFTLHTLAERATMEYADGELSPRLVENDTLLAARQGDDLLPVENGVALALLADGSVGLWAHAAAPVRDLLREIHRYATRMVRLDVR